MRRPSPKSSAARANSVGSSTGSGAAALLQRPQKIRIIGGQWKRTPLAVAPVQGLRPTPDRVRETLFNWLRPGLDDEQVLDLFAGTGALALEALSRGAKAAWLVERDRSACDSIQATIAKLAAADRAHLIRGDALQALEQLARRGVRFSIVFLDPPFGQGWLERVLPGLAAVLAPRARLYVESETAVSAEAVGRALGWAAAAAGPDDVLYTPVQPAWTQGEVRLQRADRAGQVHYHLFDLVRSAPPQGDSQR
jgi:16S rRNA (guanine(966)-N(2))-methyltransferase RsmD